MTETLGGKPSTGTPADRRLKANRDRPVQGSPEGRPAPSGQWDQSRKRPADAARQRELDAVVADQRSKGWPR